MTTRNKEVRSTIKFITVCMVLIFMIMNTMVSTVRSVDPIDTIEVIEETTPIETYERSVHESIDITYPEYVKEAKETYEEIAESIKKEKEEEAEKEAERKRNLVLDYKYGRRMSPAVDINIPTGFDMRNYTDPVDTSEYEYIGYYAITGYAPKCAHCCGSTKGITASGVEAIAGYTVATNANIPFGTTLYIEGYGYYVAEDRGGFSGNLIDIAAPSHEACYALTNNSVKVYIVHH